MRTGMVAVGLTALLAAGCGGQASPAQELADRVDVVTREANDRDADGLRDAVLGLSDTISAQRDDGTLPADRAKQLLALAATLRERADVLDPEVQARLKAEQEAERARQEAAAEKAAREQSEQRAAEQAAQAERERQQAERRAREQAEQKARRDAEAKARLDAEEKARQDAEDKGPQDAEDAADAAEDAAKQAEKAAEDAAKG